jgi:DNA-binding transcriptional MocR family regulator
MLQEEFSRGGTLQHLLLRYMQALLTQISQSAICNQRHSIDQQLRRWILQTVDRLGSKELRMTHERLANTLGVRREGISEAAHNLQRAGLITYRRGRIIVMDRVGVEADCCECYRVVRREFDRLPSPSVGVLPRMPHTAALAPDHGAPGNGLARTSELIAG